MNYTVVIPAAGVGKRMKAGKNKQLLALDGKPLMIHTLSVFERDEWCEGIVLVINPAEEKEVRSLLTRYGMTKVGQIVAGGAERQDSVYEGLKVCGEEGIVLIHDGARPFITTTVIHDLVKQAEESGSAVPAVPVTDTVKKVKDGWVTETLERSSLWAVQTPQAFRLSLIKQAYKKAQQVGIYGTDDAGLIERFGGGVAVVESNQDNIKITTPGDFVVARSILMNQGEW